MWLVLQYIFSCKQMRKQWRKWARKISLSYQRFGEGSLHRKKHFTWSWSMPGVTYKLSDMRRFQQQRKNLFAWFANHAPVQVLSLLIIFWHFCISSNSWIFHIKKPTKSQAMSSLFSETTGKSNCEFSTVAFWRFHLLFPQIQLTSLLWHMHHFLSRLSCGQKLCTSFHDWPGVSPHKMIDVPPVRWENLFSFLRNLVN